MLTAEITQFMFRQGEYILENYSITWKEKWLLPHKIKSKNNGKD